MERRKLLALSTVMLALVPLRSLHAQSTAKPFTPELLDQMLAPIALYPDALLAQTLMAAGYPLEVVEAARWSAANPALKGDAAVAVVKDKSWDVSVKSLAAFPQVLKMMNDRIDWTQKVGDAMIAQQKDVADSVQRLRAKAAAASNLKTTPQQKMTTQPSAAGGARDYIVNGRMIGGFGAIAWPVCYGETGVMTFIVSQSGDVYQRDLGPETAQRAAAIVTFNPGKDWTKSDMTPP